jgi:hypothetical protein
MSEDERGPAVGADLDQAVERLVASMALLRSVVGWAVKVVEKVDRDIEEVLAASGKSLEDSTAREGERKVG